MDMETWQSTSTDILWILLTTVWLSSILTLTFFQCAKKRKQIRRLKPRSKKSKTTKKSVKEEKVKPPVIAIIETPVLSSSTTVEDVVHTDITQEESDVTQDVTKNTSQIGKEPSQTSRSYDILRFGWIRRKRHLRGHERSEHDRSKETLDRTVSISPVSCSSSEDGFFDAMVGDESASAEQLATPPLSKKSPIPLNLGTPPPLKKRSITPKPVVEQPRPPWESTEDEPDWGDAGEDFDRVCENHEEAPDPSQSTEAAPPGGFGMDLTKVPTHLLERRSLLEMYADFFAHPDEFINIATVEDPEERMIAVVKYYLGTFYPPRKSGVAKKPYNPILGETFRCRWNVPGMKRIGKATTNGPFPGSDINQVTFTAEQVSHHPPISAFYAEHAGKRISLNAHIWTKSFFLGLSIGVANIGSATITLHDYDEKYVMTFPNAYLRSIVSSPWVELGGKCEVRCEKTGYFADIEFLTKPFFGGKPHRITGSIYHQDSKKALLTLKGEWNDVVMAKRGRKAEYAFIDVKEKSEVSKECEPIENQGSRESRKLWRHVTCALFRNRIATASDAKRWIEQRQREEAKKRQEAALEYQCKLFNKDGDGWQYKFGLDTRKQL